MAIRNRQTNQYATQANTLFEVVMLANSTGGIIEFGQQAAAASNGTVQLVAGENHIGEVGGRIAVVSNNFSIPNANAAYSSGDLVANHATNTSVTPLLFNVARAADKSFSIRRARVKKSSVGITNASFRVHCYRTSPTPTNGDNGVWLTTESTYLGSLDVTMDRAFSDGAVGIAVPSNGSEISALPSSGNTQIYALVEARAGYIPANSETFTVSFEVFQD